MIFDALTTMLFGMLGIFLVMGLIIITISLLNRFAGGKKGEEETGSKQ